MKNIVRSLLIFSLLFAFSCDQKKPANTAKANSSKPDVKTGVAPVADSEIAVIEMENPAYGKMKMELYSNIAPKAVERFKELVKEGFYDGTTFHRVEDIVIQGGDPNSKDADPNNDGQGKSSKPNVPAEFSDVPFERGIVGAARSQDPNSANCQFYITMKRFPGWDKNYTVFGKIIDGMNNADTMVGVPKNGSKPQEPLKIKSITLQAK